MELVLLATGIGLILYAIYKWGTLTFDYWKLRNIKFLKPTFLIGNSGAIFRGKYSMMEYANLLYNKFPDEKVFGMYDFRSPVLVVRDPEVLKQLTVKDFDYFENHRSFLDERSDTLFGNSLFLMRSEKWRDMRANLSPAFTSSKMRQMYDLIGDTAYEMVESFGLKTSDGKEFHTEVKDLFSKYTNDVIATAAFGIKVNSFENEKNEFYTTGKKLMNFNGVAMIVKIMLLRIAPTLSYLLGIRFFDKATSTFFRTMVLDTMHMRKERNIFRPDMINILMQLKDGKSTAITATTVEDSVDADGFATVEESNVGKAKVSRKWTDDELVAQCFLFFAAGFDTSSTALMFTVYELMRNPDIQQRLHEEVAETDRKLGGKRVPYDVLQRMRYMDQVFSESLRMWPPAPIVDRECVKDYEYDDGVNRFTFTKGTAVSILINAFHHDPQFFPNPEQFDPERFSDENKHTIQAGTYLPFGTGPRNCIGSRFALMEVKAVMYYMVLKYKFVPNKDSQIPLKLVKNPAILRVEGGLNLQMVPRV